MFLFVYIMDILAQRMQFDCMDFIADIISQNWWPGNFSVTCFSLIAWISSRILLVSSSYVFLFQCRVFWNWFVEKPVLFISQTNDRLHYHIGWLFVGVPVMLHVWVIVFAALFPANEVKLYNQWMRPNDEDGNSIPFYSDYLLSLGINDVYRLCSTTLTFGILIPYSILRFFKEKRIGRLSLNDLLQSSTKDTNVYFCGNPKVQQLVTDICTKLSLHFHAGHSFN
eukprot:613124_1